MKPGYEGSCSDGEAVVPVVLGVGDGMDGVVPLAH